eukprot:Plantae.Rhodophyta-Purpureofilum_apyrenoidigerum.ctg15945.p1 GENE.Plantae.Rhodophyta-Purpureofilum_apyrenoidigerum.ctg15945~~Plantae.Rhodophyta-Purpureofilum_apyrenoidigerum.ctg15945.p1  ORF type:complete len:101 (-),score=19.81 Plantae.Rhodophyta-Purpureofilum_apyrenoidigerum.ctg15945:86-388(-)
MHGATYTVDCELSCEELVNGPNWVVNIGDLQQILQEVLGKYNYKNLDTIEDFKGENTTTEFMCKAIHDGVGRQLQGKFSGDLKITLWESHKAWASYTGNI